MQCEKYYIAAFTRPTFVGVGIKEIYTNRLNALKLSWYQIVRLELVYMYIYIPSCKMPKYYKPNFRVIGTIAMFQMNDQQQEV